MEKAHQRIAYLMNKITKRLAGVFFLALVFLSFGARADEIRIISDEETEQFLADIIRPLFKAANIPFNRNNIFIVEDNSLNAFVSDGNHLFIHTGTIIKADNVNELVGVIAHETGHIMGGHILRQKLKAQDMNEVALVSAILAGAGAALSGRGDVAMAVMLGGQSSALNHYTSYRTSEERSADEAANKLLNATHQSPQGILQFMKKISQDNMLNGRVETPYFRTHPITTERIAFFEQKVKSSPYSAQSPYDDEFLRIKAKLKAYLLPPNQVLQEYPLTRKDIPAQYAQATAYLKLLKFDTSLQIIDNLIVKEPQNPFFYELKGQILLETGKLNEAKQNFAKAYNLLPNSYLMQLNYAQAILEDNPSKEEAKKAVDLINRSLLISPKAFSWMLLAKAYGIIGDMAWANYASAEYSFRIGALDIALNQIKSAQNNNLSKQLKLKCEDLERRIKDIKQNM